MKKSFLVVALGLVLVQGILTAQELRNVQVLPFESKKEITRFMKNSVAKSLGVKCNFCHNMRDYSSDKNPHKIVAREMMRMMAGINERFEDIRTAALDAGMKHWEETVEVECWVCHRGSTHPETAPPK